MNTAIQKTTRKGHNEGNIRKRSDGRWEVRLSAGIDYKTGKKKRTSTCCNTKQEAIAILQEQAYAVRKDGWQDPMSVTLNEWYIYWLETYMINSVKRSTYISYEGFIRNHFAVIGNTKLKTLQASTLQELYNYKFNEEGISAKTIRNMHMALHKCLEQAVIQRLLTSNPCSGVVLPRAEKAEITALSAEQQRELVQESYSHRYGIFVRLTLCTGLRLGELIAVKWEDIDMVNGTLTVRRTLNRLAKLNSGAESNSTIKSDTNSNANRTEIILDTPKTKNSRRVIPLPSGAIEELKQWRSKQQIEKQNAGTSYINDNFVVTNELGKFFEQKTFKTQFDKMVRATNIEKLTYHSLRHTFATRALERGMDYKTLSSVLGHYSVAFTMDTYVHCLDEKKRKEMDKMNDLYLS